MIKLTFPSLHSYLRPKLTNEEMKVFTDAYQRVVNSGQKDLWSIIRLLKRDIHVLTSKRLYSLIITYWDNFKSTIETCLVTNAIENSRDYPRVRFV